MSPQPAERPLLGNSAGVAILLAGLFALCHGAAGLDKALQTVLVGESYRVVDYISFHYAADAAFNRDLSPYSTATIDFYAGQLGYRVYPFLYPPYALPMLYPLSLVEYQTGAAISMVVNTVLAGVLFLVLHRMFLAHLQSLAGLLIAFVFAAEFDGIEETIRVGQVNLIAAIALLLAWQLLRQNRNPYAAGILIGIAVIVKTYFGLFLLLPLLRGEYRPVLGAAAIVLLGSAVSVALLPADLWSEWMDVAASRGGFGRLPFPDYPAVATWNESINGIATRIFGPGEAAGATATVLVLLVMTASTWRLWGSRDLASSAFYDCAFVLLSCVLLLVAPLSWFHHLVFLIGPLMCLWARGEAMKPAPVVMAGFCVIALLTVEQGPLLDLHKSWPPIASLPFVAVLLLWVFCLSGAVLPWKSRPGLA